MIFFFFFKQKTAYEMRISDWSSDVCSSDLRCGFSQSPVPSPGSAWRFVRDRTMDQHMVTGAAGAGFILIITAQCQYPAADAGQPQAAVDRWLDRKGVV